MPTLTNYPIPKLDQPVMQFELPEGQFYCITQGLASSGKTTWAETMRQVRTDVVVVCRDYIRADNQAWHGGRLYDTRREKQVARDRDNRIRDSLEAGKSVIVADTNLYTGTVNGHRKMAEEYKLELLINDTFIKNVSVEECIKRDQGRLGMVGKDVIETQYYDWWKHQPKPENRGWVDAVIVDMDGTLAIPRPGAGMYDRDFTKDFPNRDLLRVLGLNFQIDPSMGNPVTFIVMSGRQEKDREATESWLSSYFGQYDGLYMRPTGDRRPDTIVKKELYMEHVFPSRFRVVSVFDDRPSVVRMWRAELGLSCFQVGPNVEF